MIVSPPIIHRTVMSLMRWDEFVLLLYIDLVPLHWAKEACVSQGIVTVYNQLDIRPNIRQGPCLQFERLVYHELRFVAVNVNGLYSETVFHGDVLAPSHSHNSPPEKRCEQHCPNGSWTVSHRTRVHSSTWATRYPFSIRVEAHGNSIFSTGSQIPRSVRSVMIDMGYGCRCVSKETEDCHELVGLQGKNNLLHTCQPLIGITNSRLTCPQSHRAGIIYQQQQHSVKTTDAS